jgi:large subunit ribosomal protein L4
MEISVYDNQKKKVGKVAWPDKSFGKKFRSGRVYQVVVSQQKNRRQGNAQVKSRHFVAGSTAKIYRQKGTGRARHGDKKAPLFVGGGQAFGPRSRDWRSRQPKLIRRGALRDLLLMKKLDEKLWIVDKLTLKKPKTQEMAKMFDKFGCQSGLVVLGEKNDAAQKSIRNLEKFKVVRIDALNALDLLKYDHLMMTKSAYDEFLKRYA